MAKYQKFKKKTAQIANQTELNLGCVCLSLKNKLFFKNIEFMVFSSEPEAQNHNFYKHFSLYSIYSKTKKVFTV